MSLHGSLGTLRATNWVAMRPVWEILTEMAMMTLPSVPEGLMLLEPMQVPSMFSSDHCLVTTQVAMPMWSSMVKAQVTSLVVTSRLLVTLTMTVQWTSSLVPHQQARMKVQSTSYTVHTSRYSSRVRNIKASLGAFICFRPRHRSQENGVQPQMPNGFKPGRYIKREWILNHQVQMVFVIFR